MDGLNLKESWRWSDLKFLWIAVLIITTIISLFDFHPRFSVWILEIVRNLVVSASITFTIFFLSILFRVNRVVLHWTFVLKAFLVFALSGWLGGLIAWGLNELIVGINITHPWFYFIITSSLAVIFGFVVYGYIAIQMKLRQTADKLALKEINEQKLLNLKTKAELEVLRTKVNPHFLFNTLNSIASLIPENPEKAEDVVQKLSNLFRYSLDTSGETLVKLRKEMEFIKEYLEVEKVRLGDRLRYHIQVEKGLEEIELPGMLLQPLVENSIKHGISPSKIGGELFISCTRNDSHILIQIRDTGVGFDENISEGFGLSGVKERLKLLYADDYKLEISTGEGVRIQILIPIQN